MLSQKFEMKKVEENPGNLNEQFGHHLVIYGDCTTKKNVSEK